MLGPSSGVPPEQLAAERRDLGHDGGGVEAPLMLELRLEVSHVGVDLAEALAQGKCPLRLKLDQMAASVERADRGAPRLTGEGHAGESRAHARPREWGCLAFGRSVSRSSSVRPTERPPRRGAASPGACRG